MILQVLKIVDTSTRTLMAAWLLYNKTDWQMLVLSKVSRLTMIFFNSSRTLFTLTSLNNCQLPVKALLAGCELSLVSSPWR